MWLKNRRRTSPFRPVVKNERQRQGASDGLSQPDLRAENARLRRALAQAKMDNEFLSNPTAFFALRQREQKSSN